MSTNEKSYIAVDLGAESGRVMLGKVGTHKIQLDEVYRFSNGPIEQGSTLRWDFAKLLNNIKTGIRMAVTQTSGQICGIGVDSWGVDYGLINGHGQITENPYHYRDSRTNGMIEKSFEFMPKREIYENTGLQFMVFNTLYQLLSAKQAKSAALSEARKLLFIADLVSYHLCGREYAEYTMASTSQLMDMRSGVWSKNIIDKFSVPGQILPEIVRAGTVVGKLTPEVAAELGASNIPVIAIGSHDTASAVAAVPAKGDKWAYLSSGTWSLMGVETKQAIINDKSFAYQFTNEGGVCNTIRLLKNIMGLWIVQECRRQWQREGVDVSYEQIAAEAAKARPFAGFIDVDCAEFFSPGNMPAKINSYLQSRGQKPIDDKGQMVRVVLESLATKYRSIMEKIEDMIDQRISTLHIVGGGIKNELLCQFTANAINKTVVTGPVEATALGNIMMQAIATGQIKNIKQGREMIGNSCVMKQYAPQDIQIWDDYYKQNIAESGK